MFSTLVFASGLLCTLASAAVPTISRVPTCAVTLCPEGTTCVDKPTGAECVPRPCFCPAVFIPVCCESPSGERKTAGNACECTACGAPNKIVSEGECPSCALVDCVDGFKCVEKPSGPECVPIHSCPCTNDYNPVCCATPSGSVTKPNDCSCTCIPGSKILYKGNCRSKECICTTDYNPVCCQTTTGSVFEASNSCNCGCRGGTVVIGGCGIHE